MKTADLSATDARPAACGERLQRQHRAAPWTRPKTPVPRPPPRRAAPPWRCSEARPPVPVPMPMPVPVPVPVPMPVPVPVPVPVPGSGSAAQPGAPEAGRRVPPDHAHDTAAFSHPAGATTVRRRPAGFATRAGHRCDRVAHATPRCARERRP